MGFPGKIKFPICPIILPSMATRVSFDQLSVLSTTLSTVHQSSKKQNNLSACLQQVAIGTEK